MTKTTVNSPLQRVVNELMAGNAGRAIAEMETYLAAWPQAQTEERLREARETYEQMTAYWRKGYHDDGLDEQYRLLLQRVYVLFANVCAYHLVSTSSYLSILSRRVRHEEHHDWSLTAIRQRLEGFVSDVAMLELEPEHVRRQKQEALYRDHQQQVNRLFDYVLTSRQWSDGVGRDFEQLLVSPTVDTIDQQLLVSAVTLSLLNVFDMAKFRLLVNVYRQAQDEHVRQRALVGWVLSASPQWLSIYPEQRQLVGDLVQDAHVCDELTELQIQLIYSRNTERDKDTIQKEIIPDLMKTNQFRFTSKGLEEVDDDPLEDVLNPEASEQRMEKVEQMFQRMQDMRRQGTDIFFGSFSQMKRFPFFYETANWLVPFYLQHPDIQQFLGQQKTNQFLQKVVSNVPFCNSDKYSFVIAFQQVVQQLPESMRNLISSGEVGMVEMTEEESQAPAYIRRSYLMDLYRFFKLFPNRSQLRNPFDTERSELGDCLFFSSPLFDDTPLEERKDQLVRLLKRQKLESSAQLLLATYKPAQRGVQYYLWLKDYDQALQLAPDNEQALAGKGRALFSQGQYDESLALYDRLLLLHPDKLSYQLGKAVCLVNMKEYDDALQMLYRLNYADADNVHVNRVLAWTLVCDGKLEQAERLFQQLQSTGSFAGEDEKNYGYCLWLQGRIDEAVLCFRHYYEEAGKTGDGQATVLDEAFLTERGITPTEIKLMASFIF